METLLLIDRRRDDASGDGITQAYSQEIRAIRGTSFSVDDVPGNMPAESGSVLVRLARLMGPGDQILATGGAKGPYMIWKIESVDLVSKKAITLK